LPTNLERVKQATQRSRQTKFTALLHHLNEESLRRAFGRLKRDASPGIDGETVAEYGVGLERRLQELCTRVHTGRYRPQAIRRVHIPKADGGQRPLGILCLEDKIVQGAIAEILSAIYEVDFCDNSYGFRQGRNPHQALKAVQRGLMDGPMNWVLDADIRSFFDSVDHELMLRALRQRIADPRMLRLIEQWLKVGVLESDECLPTERGTPQGATISPLLANVFLHYALDMWVNCWKEQTATGQIIMVRYADDFVMGFQYKADAEQMLEDLRERMSKCGLQLHSSKTRLIEFGRFAAKRRAQRSEGKPETFDFLGFTHYCSETRSGRFMVKRKTQAKRMRRKLQEVRMELRRRMHTPIGEQHSWLCSVLHGHYEYFGVPCNSRWLAAFRDVVVRTWFRSLNRRERKRRYTWRGYQELLRHFPLPGPGDARTWQPLQLALW
jgi:group II intron reverse transcriptase/maturase